MFIQHTAKATVDSDDIKEALALLVVAKGQPGKITVEKFRYKKGTLIFTYTMEAGQNHDSGSTGSSQGKTVPASLEGVKTQDY